MKLRRSSDGKPAWLVSAARAVRSSDRLSGVGNRAVEGVQGNRTLVDIATRVFAFSGGVPVIYLRGGAPLDGVEHQERLPVVLVNAVGVEEAHLAGILQQVAEVQQRTVGFRPLLLLSVPAFREVRAYGWPMELVVAQQDWDFPQQWDDYLAQRLAMIATRYRIWSTVGCGDGALDPMGARILERLATYRPWETSFL
ncbi:hypothetical protein [Nostocoides veronense]|uniref:Uncharacterized protein n=1 Tax=Nostocoides veronense TaxID=330836 RepID=A0ABN2LDE5_9MICO